MSAAYDCGWRDGFTQAQLGYTLAEGRAAKGIREGEASEYAQGFEAGFSAGCAS